MHPGVPAALEAFDPDRFRDCLRQALFVGEVGLDGRARTDRVAQARAFDAILALVSEDPRPVTVHSTAATAEVLAALRARPIPGAILHWWRGSVAETREAIELGCFFSVNGHEIKQPKVLELLPADRVLPETDFPHSKRYDAKAIQPGATQTFEDGLAALWEVSQAEVRRRLWLNFGRLLSVSGVLDRMPRAVLATLATAGYDG